MQSDILVKDKIIVLEDGKEFLILDVINTEEFTYLLLVNVYNDTEIMIRKYDKDLDLIVGLDSESEVRLVASQFAEKNIDNIDKI